MNAFVFLADGFEEIEAITPIDILRRAGIEVIIISISTQKVVRGAHGISITADCLFSEADFSNASLLLLPGGMPGTKNLEAHEGLKNLLFKQAEQNKYIAAICAAPSILGKMGLLKGEKANCFPGFEKDLFGAILSESTVVKAGNIITAKGAGVATQFALKIVEELKGESVAQSIANAICIDEQTLSKNTKH